MEWDKKRDNSKERIDRKRQSGGLVVGILLGFHQEIYLIGHKLRGVLNIVTLWLEMTIEYHFIVDRSQIGMMALKVEKPKDTRLMMEHQVEVFYLNIHAIF